MPTRFLISMYFSYVSNSGGVIDVARNLIDGLDTGFTGRFAILSPSSRIKHSKVRTLLRFLCDLAIGMRYYFSKTVVLFPNYFCIPMPMSRVKSVVVVHDLMFKHYPQYVSPLKRLIFDVNYRIVKRHADGVIFISKDSQDDFIRTYGEPRKFTYIYNPVVLKGVHPGMCREVGPKDGTPYVIANFHYYPHKNLGKLLEVFEQIHADWPELHLVFTGNKPPQFESLIASSPARKAIMHLGFLPKEQVMALIRDAAFFMSMSQFEGFNMSAAEAGLFGKPLVLSDIPVHRELFSDCAQFVAKDASEIDVAAIIAFVRGYQAHAPRYAQQVQADVVAARYVAFIDEVAAC